MEGSTDFGEIAGLQDGPILWAAAHFVFNQKTANAVKNTAWFLYKYILLVEPERQPSQSAQHELNLLPSSTTV